MTRTATKREYHPMAYRHEALLYEGFENFSAATLPFIEDALDHQEPILIAVSRLKIDLLTSRIGSRASSLSFVDMEELGRNPARIISAWRAFVSEHSDSGTRVRGIGEPVDASQSADKLSECQLHEQLLNVAFDDAALFWLLCPYDVSTLASEVINQARTSHPYMSDPRLGSDEHHGCASDKYRPIDATRPFERSLSPPPETAVELAFVAGDLRKVRRFAVEQARLAGLKDELSEAIAAAVNELATNSLQHGGGAGLVRGWSHDGGVVFEVVDHGQIQDPLVGRIAPDVDAESGRGLWIVHHLCDLVQIQSSSSGTVVRVRAHR
jgi:anti-sigma regulatory factor (Ser/Thr protein kinase)